MSIKPTIFEKYPKLLTLISSIVIFAITLSLVAFILKLNVLQDSKDGEKYSIADKIKYSIRCHNRRYIKLREHRPNKHRLRFPATKYDTLEHKEYLVRTDKDGIIEPAFIHKKPDLQIFFIGGSTTECENVDEEFRFPYLSGRILEEKTGLKINSDNAARSGNNSLHSINIIVNKILPYNPDMIVMMHNINDLSTLIYEGSYWNYNKSKSHLVCTHKNTKIQKKNDEWARSVYQKKVLASKEEQDQLIEKYKQNLMLFISIARSHNIIPVLMTQANRIEKDDTFTTGRGADFDKLYRKLYIKFNETIRQFGKENNVFVIDLANHIPGTEEFIYDRIHINKEGSIMVSNKIAKEISYYLKKAGY